jgi:hypothetical protein
MTAVASTAQMTVKAPIPTKVYAKGDVLFVQNGADFRMVARVGELGKLAVSQEYPRGAFAAQNMDWAQDREGVANYMATAINAFPVLRRRVSALETANVDIAAKLAVAKEALKRSASLDAGYVAALVNELELCLGRNKV